ncbi:MAG: sulfurtransferase [Pseudomonadota bacterium]
MTLIDPATLHARLSETVVLDASWHMPATGRDAAAEFLTAHIPGAQRFDIDRVADQESGLPHTLPAPDAFAATVGAMGVDNAATVTVYEAGPPFSAPRVWWMFRVMGLDVTILDGGLARWTAEGFATETGPAPPPPAKAFLPSFNPALLADADAVEAALSAGTTVVDVRSPGRYAGEEDEPRPGVRAGHMPGALNLHYATLIGDDGRLLPRDTLQARLGHLPDGPVITSCGSGVTAAILSLALHEIGRESAVYDGSWTEWGADAARAVIASNEP